MAERRTGGAPAVPSADGPQGPGTARRLERLVVAQLKDMGDIDGFLSSFERACGLQRVPPADWLLELIPALNQEAAGVLSQLEDLQPGDYNRVKEALLHKFGLTPEMYRKKFRGVQKGPWETYVDLASRLAQYGRKWVSGVGAQTAEELLKLVLMEQFYEACPPKLRLWLKDRRPENPQEAGRLVDEFTESRSGCERESRREREPRRDRFSADRRRESAMGRAPGTRTSHQYPRKPARARAELTRMGPQNLTCHRCGQRGHKRAQCTRRKNRSHDLGLSRVNWLGREEGQAAPEAGAGRQTSARGEGKDAQCISPGRSDPRETDLSVYRVGAGRPLRRDCLVPLEVDGRKVTGFWDTGAEVTLARPDIVGPDRMLPDTQLTLRGIGSTPFKVPVARVHLKWEAKEGPKEVGVHPHLPTDVLMGSDLEEWPDGPHRTLVTTRSQSQRGAGSPELEEVPQQGAQGPVPADLVLDLGSGGNHGPVPAPAAEFQEEVRADPSLQALRDRADLGAAQPLGGDCQEKFRWERGFLFQECLPPRKARAWGVQRQLVVPQKYRLKLLYLAHDVPVGGHRGIRSTRLRLLQHFY
ncbi:uncharacterized protein LOC142825738 [Pelodiscus sinensis]|uniref:uncharacterized protein LOC142825738 n=1 Tax=Pelodiscus sinensis TaxID=13735 RepID=UPI003F6A6496